MKRFDVVKARFPRRRFGTSIAGTMVTGLLVSILFASSSAGIPAPGTHGVSKRWPGVDADVTNFSPFAFDGRIAAIVPDRQGGVWFGIARTLEHIDANGIMQNHVLSSEPLWQIKGFAYDPAGRLWFSLGQSGRIGTIDARGALRTRVLVARRFFPDIRDIAFDRFGSVWFADRGRMSIGRTPANGETREVPYGYGTDFALCGGRVWFISIVNHRFQEMASRASDLSGFRTEKTWRAIGTASLACGAGGTLYYTHTSRFDPDVDGTRDSRGRALEQPALLQDEIVYADPTGSIWRYGASDYDGTDRPDVVVLHGDRRRRLRWRLEITYYEFRNMFAANADGTLWLGLVDPNSVVRIGQAADRRPTTRFASRDPSATARTYRVRT